MKKSCGDCKWLTCEDSEICEIGIDANACINWEESELSKCQRKASVYFERSKAKTNEIVLLKHKLDIAVEALGNAYHVSINESDWSVRKTITEALEKLKELK